MTLTLTPSSAESGVSLTMMLRRMTSSGATIVLETVAAIAPASRCTRASLESSLYLVRVRVGVGRWVWGRGRAQRECAM